jgi:hypothetical protein
MPDKVKRTRVKKQTTADDLMVTIESQSLETKVRLVGLLNQSITAEAKVLEDKLKLINDIK